MAVHFAFQDSVSMVVSRIAGTLVRARQSEKFIIRPALCVRPIELWLSWALPNIVCIHCDGGLHHLARLTSHVWIFFKIADFVM